MNRISKTKIELYSRLSQSKQRRKLGLFAAEGLKCVTDTLEAFDIEALVVTENFVDCCARLLERHTDKVAVCTQAEMKRISSLSSAPEIMAIYRMPLYEETLPLPQEGKPALLLDGVQDPGNLGTIVRTAHWFGFDTIYASRSTADIFSAKAIQASMGSVAAVGVVYCDLVSLADDCPSRPVYGLQLDGMDIFTVSSFPAGLIVMGSEGNGISEQMKARVSDPLTIPPVSAADHPDSLNVAVASAITLAAMIKKK